MTSPNVPTVVMPEMRYTIGGKLTPLNRLASNRGSVRGSTLSSTQGDASEAMRSPPSKACCWPLWGDLEKPTHLYCGKPKAEGRSYCPRHCKLAHSNASKPSLAGIRTR